MVLFFNGESTTLSVSEDELETLDKNSPLSVELSAEIRNYPSFEQLTSETECRGIGSINSVFQPIPSHQKVVTIDS